MSFIGSMLSDDKGSGFQGSAAGAPGTQTAGVVNQNLQPNIQANQDQVAFAQALLRQRAQNGDPIAQAQLQQATNANMKQTAGMIASTKGINPALAARTAAEINASTGQQAANQSAILNAQAKNTATGELANTGLSQQNIDQNAISSANSANVGMQSNINEANAGIAKGNQQFQQQLFGGLLNGVAQGAMMAAKGGMVPGYADGGEVAAVPITNPPAPAAASTDGPQSSVGKFLKGFSGGMDPQPQKAPPVFQGASSFGKMITKGLMGGGGGLPSAAPTGGTSMAGGPMDSIAELAPAAVMVANKGGRVPAKVSPGEVYLSPNKVEKVAKEGKSPIQEGEKIPGKAKVKGDSLKNDTVSKNLESGGIVIPRSVMQSDDPAHNAYKFVQAVLAKQGLKR